MKKLLLHTCCVSCLSYAHKRFSEIGFVPVVLFYNPNINGKIEYLNRLKDVESYARSHKLQIIVPEYNENDYLKPIEPWQDKKSIKYISDINRFRRKRCEFCYHLRIIKTAELSKKNRIKHFSTTLLTSPYQDHEFIDYIASQVAKDNKLEFIYLDLRKGFWQGRNYCRAHKFLIPTYCGCTFSTKERMLE